MDQRTLLARVDSNVCSLSSPTCIGLAVTDRCPVGCRHCIVSADKDTYVPLSLETYRKRIAKISEAHTIRSVVLTGGEPFAVYESLLCTISLIRDHGMGAGVITSACWASTKDNTERTVAELRRTGLVELAVSVDKFHQERIDIQNPIRAILAAKRHGIGVTVCYSVFGHRLEREKAVLELAGLLGNAIESVDRITIGLVLKAGRAARELRFPEAEGTQRKKYMLCSAISPVVLCDGTVSSCCGPGVPKNSPLILGNLDHVSISEILSLFERHPLLPYLQVLGLTDMVALLKGNGLGNDLPLDTASESIGMCALCHAILSNGNYVDFFVSALNDTTFRRRLAVKMFLLHGDTSLLEGHQTSR